MLQVKNLSVGYDGKAILKNISFNIEKGSYLCIVGENGSGKTTLVKTMLSLQKQISGEIIFDKDFDRKDIGYLSQELIIKNDFPATNYEIVLSGFIRKLEKRPFYTKEEKKKALDAMEKFNVDKIAKESFASLSGGQKQRVLLARAICATNKLLFLDEPLTGLDPKATKEFYNILKDLNENENMTIIMISHNIGEALKYASHIVHVGEEVVCMNIDDYKKSEYIKKFSI